MAERRRFPARGLRVPVILFLDEGEPLSTETVNVSDDGFYCGLDRPVAPGARMRFRMGFSRDVGNRSDLGLCVEGVAHVVRLIVRNTAPSFAIECRIEDYRIVQVASSHA
jgi:hypothetical protein